MNATQVKAGDVVVGGFFFNKENRYTVVEIKGSDVTLKNTNNVNAPPFGSTVPKLNNGGYQYEAPTAAPASPVPPATKANKAKAAKALDTAAKAKEAAPVAPKPSAKPMSKAALAKAEKAAKKAEAKAEADKPAEPKPVPAAQIPHLIAVLLKDTPIQLANEQFVIPANSRGHIAKLHGNLHFEADMMIHGEQFAFPVGASEVHIIGTEK